MALGGFALTSSPLDLERTISRYIAADQDTFVSSAGGRFSAVLQRVQRFEQNATIAGAPMRAPSAAVELAAERVVFDSSPVRPAAFALRARSGGEQWTVWFRGSSVMSGLPQDRRGVRVLLGTMSPELIALQTTETYEQLWALLNGMGTDELFERAGNVSIAAEPCGRASNCTLR